MPPVGAGYTFADFLRRLERSPVAHMSPLYHEHRLLFVNRPDMLSKAILSISWERGLALLEAAYYAQPVAAESYRALLARMLRHNRHVTATGAGQLVSWQAAMKVMNEAVVTHGTALPTRVSVSALRLLAPHRQWETAIDVLKLNQVNGQLTKPMLLDAAHACASPAAWPHALHLLQHLHKQDPPLLFDAIQSMRPPGSNALTSSETSHALLASVRDGAAPTAAQQHVLAVLNSVVATVPHEVALHDPLCKSYLSHLLASTTLSPEVKVQRATAAVAQLPWMTALQLLSDLSEPAVLTEGEWSSVQRSLLLASSDSATDKRPCAKKGKGARRTRKKRTKAMEGEEAADAVGSAPPGDSDASVSSYSAAAEVAPATAALFSRLQLLRTSPLTSAAMIAVMVEKLPTPEMAVSFIRSCAAHLSAAHGAAGPSAGVASSSMSSFPSGQTGSAAATRHPVVVHALLRKCVQHPTGWSTAANVLLDHSGSQMATPTELLSAVVRQLRQARQVSLVVRLLHEHIIPSGSLLTQEAWEDVLECALAHNRAIQARRAAQDGNGDGEQLSAAAPPSRHHGGQTGVATAARASASLTGVHWVSALSWVLDRQAASREERIQKTGTGPSQGATARHPTAHVQLEKPLSPRLLSLLVNICVHGGSPQGALQAMGYARRVSKTELTHTAQIRALLYCMQYDRPYEAAAMVEQVARKEGEAAAQPLQHLLKLMSESSSVGDEP